MMSTEAIVNAVHFYMIGLSNESGHINVTLKDMQRMSGYSMTDWARATTKLRRNKLYEVVTKGNPSIGLKPLIIVDKHNKYKTMTTINNANPTISNTNIFEAMPNDAINKVQQDSIKPTGIISVFKSKAVSFMQEICQMDDVVTLLTAERDQYKSQFEEAQRKIEKMKECLQ